MNSSNDLHDDVCELEQILAQIQSPRLKSDLEGLLSQKHSLLHQVGAFDFSLHSTKSWIQAGSQAKCRKRSSQDP